MKMKMRKVRKQGRHKNFDYLHASVPPGRTRNRPGCTKVEKDIHYLVRSLSVHSPFHSRRRIA